MSTIVLCAELPDWGYTVAGRAEPDPRPTPPCETYRLQTWMACPGWVRWELRGALDDAAAIIWVAQRPRLDSAEPWQTELIVGGVTTVVAGHAAQVRAELVRHREVQVYLDGSLAATGSVTAVGSWSEQPWFVFGEGNSGFEAWLDGQVDGATGLYAQTGHAVSLFAARLSVCVGGREQPVLPVPVDTCHVWAGESMSGVVPAMVKRLPLLIHTLTSQRGDHAVVADLEAVVQPRLVASVGDAPYSGPGLSYPVAGWLAGMDATGPYTFANGRHALASPLGLTANSRSAALTAVCAVRAEPEDDWSASLEVAGPLSAVLLTSEGDLAAFGADLRRAYDRVPQWTTNASLPTGRSLALLDWVPTNGYLADVDWRHEDFPLAVGCQRHDWGTRLLVKALSGEVTVADLTAAEGGCERLWPWLHSCEDGARVVGLVAGGRHREWQSPADGSTWDPAVDQVLPEPADVVSVTAAHGRDGTLLAAAYNPGLRQVTVWHQVSGGGWSGPFVVAGEVPAAAPYAAHLPDGQWEVGWLVDEAWVRYRAGSPAGPWRQP